MNTNDMSPQYSQQGFHDLWCKSLEFVRALMLFSFSEIHLHGWCFEILILQPYINLHPLNTSTTIAMEITTAGCILLQPT